MTEETAAPEAGGAEAVAPVEPASSAREALSRQFADWESDTPAAEDVKPLEASEAEDDAPPEKPRDEKGRFAPSEAKAEAKAEDKPAETEKPADAPKAGDPPPGFSEQGKAAWKDVPEPVKADVARRFREMEAGLKGYQADYGDLREYAAMAKQNGTTLKAAYDRYVGMENLLRTNPEQALKEIAGNVGIDLAEMAGREVPADVKQVQQQARQYQQQATALAQENESLKAQIKQAQESQIQQQVDQFKADRPRFDELEPVMAWIISTGGASDLAAAYEMADRLRPSPEPAPMPEPQAPQTRAPVSRSVAGAPPSGSNPAARKPSASAREAVSRALGM